MDNHWSLWEKNTFQWKQWRCCY